MKNFLHRIAKAYSTLPVHDLQNCCFVFPNKRSCTFFKKYLLDEVTLDTPFFEPEITTISEFIAHYSPYAEASRYDLLFTLYNEYSKLSDNIESFDRFVFWGDMLISDFNDVDRYLVDARQLFRNVKNLREINSDFLSEEQKEIISKYWDIELPQNTVDRFWTHVIDDSIPHDNRDAFVQLWEILGPLYANYRESLAQRGMCYSGMEYRHVAKKIINMEKENFHYDRIIFSGFNVLSSSELAIFERLRDIGLGDFYWDFDFPVPFKDNTSASHFIRRYINAFPSKFDISIEVDDIPDIEIIGVPSNSSQTKIAGKLLESMIASGEISDSDNAMDTAVVLPAEELFMDLLHSLSPSLTSINITMGYPLKLTPVATLLQTITSLHLRCQLIRGEWCFFYEDVTDLVSHPLLRLIDYEVCEGIKTYIEDERIFMLPSRILIERFPQFKTFFVPVEDPRSLSSVFSYIYGVVDFLIENIRTIDGNNDMNLEKGFLTRYRLSIDSLYNAIDTYNLSMKESTFFHLLEKMVLGESVNFVGEPLKGLQVMGVLETRSLDFDNVIMLSMNERIFPRKLINRSFIPNSLRSAYGMSTSEFQECIFAYYFYRLISRASHVKLLYDTRTSGLRGGEMSRYLYQLIYSFPSDKVKVTNASFDVAAISPGETFEIIKDEKVMEILNRFISRGENRRYLSPSAINTYLNCPLQFYFQYVQRISNKDELVDYMDESTFGSIVHAVAEESYKRIRQNAAEVKITREVLSLLKKEELPLQRIITNCVNRLYNKLPNQSREESRYENLSPLQGEARILGEIINDFIKQLFTSEMNHAPFYFVEGEQEFKTTLPLDDSLRYNIKGTIDRIDRLENGDIRIVDYKTGKDEIAVGDIEELVTAKDERHGHKKGVLQLFLYCNAYAHIKGYTGAITPRLFLFKKLHSDGLEPVTINKEELTDYRTYNREVMEKLNEKLKTLFDSSVPFCATPSESHCNFCNFKILCGQSAQ